jgi:CheY-like chemotaxis protein
MAAGRSEETALGSAHGRFFESLPRKAIELRGTIALLTATPAAEGPRGELRRKLHALYASALVFRSDPLAALVQEGIQLLDAASDAKRALGSDELATLSSVVKRVAELRADGRSSTQPPAPAAAPAHAVLTPVVPPPRASSVPPAGGLFGYSRSEGPRRSATLTGLLPVGAPQAIPSEMPGRWVSRPSLFASELRREAPRPMLQRVLHVLVVASEERVTEMASLLSADSLRVSTASATREALDLAREDAPDVVIAESQQAFAGGLMAGLRADPLTDFVPVVVIADSDAGSDRDSALAHGADDVVTRPLRSDPLIRVLGRVTGTLVEVDALEPAPAEATIDEVCTRVSQEIRRGLVEATESGRELKVQLGEGAEVMAAAWAAVARVRALFTERSGGRVRFVDRPSSAAPSLLSVGPAAALGEGLEQLAGQSPLAGRRILVADDDTAVVLFFAGLLRDEGASVTEVTDGAEALRAARRERPDLIISDVVMPGLSGFALCRELKRDPLLADVPVILISWKEDLLVRMRELSSGASGYLRKEASAVQILAGVRDALRSRSQLETRLAEPGEVRGNLDGTGVVALLRSVRRARPDSRLTLRDAWNMFECELRDGRLSQLTRTAADGSFVRNEAALPQLLGVSTGRFSVSSAEGPLKQAVEGTLDEALARGARELGAQLDVLSGSALDAIERVILDEDAQAALLEQSPPLVRDVVNRLTQGQTPRQIWQDGIIERAMLESMLLDMAKRGAIRAVVGANGDDLIEAARIERERQPTPDLGSPFSLLPPAPAPVISMLPAEPEPSPRDSAPPELQEAAEALAEGGLLERTPASMSSSLLPPAPEPNMGVEPTALPSEPPPSSIPAEPAAPAVEAELPASAVDTVPIVTPSSRPKSDARELDRAAADARTSRGTLWAWTAAFVALVAIGFLADRARNQPAAPKLEAIGAAPAQPLAAQRVVAPQPAEQKPAPSSSPSFPASSSAEPRAPQRAAVSAEEGGFQIFDRVLEEGIKVAPDQALLVVQSEANGDTATLTVDGKSVGSLPAKMALSEGMHELAISRGDSVKYRFLAPRRGATWLLREP